MKDEKKTKQQLINELVELRQRIAELKASETQHKLEEAFKESEERAKAQYKGIPIPTYTWQKTDNDFILIDYNHAGEEITQGKVSDWLGAKLSEMYKDMPYVIEDMGECFNKKTIIKTEMLYKFRSFNKERYFIVHYSYAPPDLVLVHTEDITERKRTEEALRESEERYRTIFEDSRDAIYITSRDGKFINFNPSVLDLFGYSKDEMMEINAQQIYASSADRDKFRQEIEQKGSVKNYSVKLRKKDETEIDCLLTSTIWKSIDGTILGYHGIIRDITDIKKVEDQLIYLSLHDPLTGLYNRAYFGEEMKRIENGRYDSAAVIMCDVDGLKLVNDALGHHAGDDLLIATANILKESFRESDVIARVGGDEFAVLVANTDSNAIEKACHRIQNAAARYNLANPVLPLSVSMGFAVSIGTPIIMGSLFKEADNNMYRAKLQHSLIARSTIVQTLMKALETRDFITKGHVDRLQKLAIALAQAIGLPDQRVTDLRLLAEFHDIGKVGIPEHILFKPGPLTPEEIIEMQKHCEIGHRIAMYTPDLVPIADLILKHHEWWNGEGYPLSIKGEDIPIECRILSICETYEILTSDRPYHKATSHEEAAAELTRHSGIKFDPDLVSKFIQVLESIRE
ncbi:MAG: diguanylate cyclase [Nitrospirota bacterium]